MSILAKDKIQKLLNLPLTELISYADKVRQKFVPDHLEVCGILNIKSGACGEDCKFCAQSSRYTASIKKYPLLGEDKIIAAARQSKNNGAKRFGLVASGRRLSHQEVEVISGLVREIKSKVGINVCASLGSLASENFKVLKQAGVTRYHHNLETSPRFYRKIVSTHNFKERTATIAAAKNAGLEVCSGGIIGMGETWQDRIDLACLLKELKVDTVPLNFLVPIPGTPLAKVNLLSCAQALKVICLFRIILEDKIIRIAAGRETVLKDFQGAGFMAGANGLLIGGYLTIKGRSVEEDLRLIREIKRLWKR